MCVLKWVLFKICVLKIRTYYAYSECVFNWKCVLKKPTEEVGKIQAKSVKILNSQAKFTKFCVEILNYKKQAGRFDLL